MSDGPSASGRSTDTPRTCDCCGKRNPDPQPIRQRAMHKATVYMPGTFYWCRECRRDNNGTWKYAR